jgi:hypothetical protein
MQASVEEMDRAFGILRARFAEAPDGQDKIAVRFTLILKLELNIFFFI